MLIFIGFQQRYASEVNNQAENSSLPSCLKSEPWPLFTVTKTTTSKEQYPVVVYCFSHLHTSWSLIAWLDQYTLGHHKACMGSTGEHQLSCRGSWAEYSQVRQMWVTSETCKRCICQSGKRKIFVLNVKMDQASESGAQRTKSEQSPGSH